MSVSSAFGKKKGKSKSKQDVTIPDFLRPFVNQSVGVAGGALGGLQSAIGSGGDLTAGFAPAQQLAQFIGTGRALDPNSPFATATGTAQEIAMGGGTDPAAEMLQQLMQGGQILPEAFRGLQQGIEGGALPGQEQLAGLAGQSGIPDVTMDTLTGTAQGDFLFGGQGFDQAVQAAMRAAQPGIMSAFGGAGRGGATSGLAQQAIAQSGIDAFARQFGQERQNQLGAAGQLGQLGLAGQGQQADIANLMAQLGLSGRSQQIGASGALGQLGLSGSGQQLSAALGLGDFGLNQNQQRLGAASALPGLATADINLLSGIGGQQQGLEQQRIDAPINAQLQLLQAALGGLPVQSFLGQRNKGRDTDSAFSMGFGG